MAGLLCQIEKELPTISQAARDLNITTIATRFFANEEFHVTWDNQRSNLW